MRAYHIVRTIGVTIETCSFSRKRRERKTQVSHYILYMRAAELSSAARCSTDALTAAKAIGTTPQLDALTKPLFCIHANAYYIYIKVTARGPVERIWAASSEMVV